MFVSKDIAEVVIMVSKDRANTLTSALLASEMFHPIALDSSFPGYSDPNLQRAQYELNSKVKKLEDYLKEMREFAPTFEGTLKVSDWLKFSKEVTGEIASIEAKVDPLIVQIREGKQQASKLIETLKLLEPICQLDVDLKRLSELKIFAIKIGEIPREYAESISSLMGEGYTFVWQRNEEKAFALVVVLREEEKALEKKLSSIGFKQLELPEGLPPNPVVACEETRKELEELEEMLEARRKELMEFRGRILELYAKAATALGALKLLAMSKYTDYHAIIRGFVPSDSVKKLKNILKRSLGDEYIFFTGRIERGFNIQGVPSSVSVPRLLAPFKMLVDNYGAPKTSEIYPALMVAITFPIIFALMFPDAGHGLLVMLFGYFMMRKARGREGWKNTGLLAIYLGAASIVTGILAGEFFGPLTKLSELLWNGHPLLPTPFEGGASAVDIMINVSLRLGATLLILGTFLGFLNYLLERNLSGALAIGLPKFLAFTFALYPFLIYNAPQAGSIIYGAIFGGAGGLQSMLVKWGASMSLLFVFLAEPAVHAMKHEEGSLSSALIMSFMEMFDTVLMMIGNTASFLRILGLSVAHAGLMYSFAVLADLLAGGIIGTIAAVLVYALGNLLAAGLEGIIVFAHSLRLHYYEWFSKFYSGSGMPFSPLRPMLNIIIE
ncbi:MAG: V-type ATP synthase subunit I [Fervidicoccaceae archaeon]